MKIGQKNQGVKISRLSENQATGTYEASRAQLASIIVKCLACGCH